MEFHNVQSLGAFPGNQRRTSVNFFSNFYVQLKEISDVKQTMNIKQMKRASKKGKTLTINKIPSSVDFRMNFRRLKLIESFL